METKKTSVASKIVTIVLLAICVYLAAVIGMHYASQKQASSQAQAMGTRSSGTNTINVSVKTLATDTFTRTTTLGADLSSSMDTVDLYSSDVAGKITALDISVGQVIKAGDTIATVDPSSAGEQYKPSDVKASIGGTIYSVDSYVGQTISTSTALGTVGSAGELEVIAYMNERFLSTVKPGMQATFTTMAWPNEPFDATIKTISPKIDASNRTFKVTLFIDKPDQRLKEGMYVKLKLIVEEVDDAIIVPTKAISTYLGNNVVYVVDGNAAKRVQVSLGSANDSETVITGGLSTGDQLIVAGSVTDGSPVAIVEE
ncbi:MAG: efflux RND transporter periplasmic adaptor subunit [Sphaerochaetaceae bacterium]|jgi:multidrug efflux pump subunit AcrA (membrane-fusion protein)